MLRITQSVLAGAAEEYFRQALRSGEYYAQNDQSVGIWGGMGAQELQLVGEVDKKAFRNLASGLHPASGEQLTAPRATWSGRASITTSRGRSPACPSRTCTPRLTNKRGRRWGRRPGTKDQGVPYDEALRRWKEQLGADGLQSVGSTCGQTDQGVRTLDEVVKHAVADGFARESVLRERMLIAGILKAGVAGA